MTITITKQDGIATVKLDRADKLNALTGEMYEALADAFAELTHDDAVRAVVLTGAVAHGLLSVSGYFLNDWHWNHFMVVIAIPTAMWLVATYIAVVRFLSYLDLRIRNEGWEVELRLRAEAGRLAGRIA